MKELSREKVQNQWIKKGKTKAPGHGAQGAKTDFANYNITILDISISGDFPRILSRGEATGEPIGHPPI